MNSGDKKGATAEGASATPAERFLVAGRFADIGILPNLLTKQAGIPGIPELKRPKWVIRCSEKFNQAMFPDLVDRSGFQAKEMNYQAGFALGLVEGGLMKMEAVFERLGPWPKMREPTDDEIKQALHFLFGEPGLWLWELLEDDGVIFSRGIEGFEADLTLAKAANYAEGRASALRMLAGANKKNEATDIYLFLLLYWRVVERLETVDHLHRVITKVFGPNLAGSDPKRIAQICQRVGLKYRARGRPPKQPQARWPLR